jgi:hypothetical protein
MTPAGLVAPTLCPRCDAPTAAVNGDRDSDHCPHCSLQLRWCANCRGAAGPFDRYCGFCGFELIRAERPGRLRRLWVLVALVPLAAGLAYGLWVARVPAAVAGAVHPQARAAPAPSSSATAFASQGLGLRYSPPRDWTAVDYTRGPAARPAVVISEAPADQAAASGADGDLSQVDHSQAAVVALGRPPAAGGLVADASDPLAALTAELAPMVAAPPAGVAVEVAQPARAVSIGGRPGAEVVLKLTRDSGVTYLRRDLVYGPHDGAQALLRADALVPASEWPAANAGPVTSVVRSLSFG